MDIKAFNHMLLHYYVLIPLLLLLLNSYVSLAYHDDTHNVAKRLDVDVCTGEHRNSFFFSSGQNQFKCLFNFRELQDPPVDDNSDGRVESDGSAVH
jgi:hypothetical protein